MTIPPTLARGRPRLFGHLFTVYADDEMDAAIRAYAQRSGVSVAAALRELLEFGLESLNTESQAA